MAARGENKHLHMFTVRQECKRETEEEKEGNTRVTEKSRKGKKLALPCLLPSLVSIRAPFILCLVGPTCTVSSLSSHNEAIY